VVSLLLAGYVFYVFSGLLFGPPLGAHVLPAMVAGRWTPVSGLGESTATLLLDPAGGVLYRDLSDLWWLVDDVSMRVEDRRVGGQDAEVSVLTGSLRIIDHDSFSDLSIPVTVELSWTSSGAVRTMTLDTRRLGPDTFLPDGLPTKWSARD
jgi:hypothetical protein